MALVPGVSGRADCPRVRVESVPAHRIHLSRTDKPRGLLRGNKILPAVLSEEVHSIVLGIRSGP